MTGFVQLRPAGRLVVGLFLGIALWFSSPNRSGNVAAQQDLPPLSYTIAQAERGPTAYLENCAACHGENMDDGEFAIPLKGVNFRQQWRVRSLAQLFTVTSVTMPQDRPGRVGDETYADILAYILQDNSVFPDMTVEENLLMGGFIKDKIDESFEEAEKVLQKYERFSMS